MFAQVNERLSKMARDDEGIRVGELSLQSNHRPFLKATTIVICGIALLIDSGALNRSYNYRRRSFPGDPKQAVQEWLGLGLIAAGIWFFATPEKSSSRSASFTG